MGAVESTENELDLVWVRWRDVHERRRHPVRRTVAFIVDAALHLTFSLVIASVIIALIPGANFWAQLAAFVGPYLLVSFAHRVFLQRALRTTLGKGLVGLRVVRRGTGARASTEDLIALWFIGYAMVVLLPLQLLAAL